MTQSSNKIWQAGKVINAGQGENEFVSLIRPSTPQPPAQPAAASDDYALARRPSHVISTGERPNSSVLTGNPFQKRNA